MGYKGAKILDPNWAKIALFPKNRNFLGHITLLFFPPLFPHNATKFLKNSRLDSQI